MKTDEIERRGGMQWDYSITFSNARIPATVATPPRAKIAMDCAAETSLLDNLGFLVGWTSSAQCWQTLTGALFFTFRELTSVFVVTFPDSSSSNSAGLFLLVWTGGAEAGS